MGIFTKRILSNDRYLAALNANLPSAANPFATMADLSSFVAPVHVANFSALPNPVTVPGAFYYADASQGTKWLPGSLGGTYYPNGFYYSDGSATWIYSESPYNAPQPTMDAGLNNDQFGTPLTINNLAKWGTKADTIHTHNLADVTNVTITAANLNSLDDGVNSALHFHDSDRARVNHTGTQISSTISDFATTVLSTLLTGLSVATAQVIASTDTVLLALGYLQAQVNLRVVANTAIVGATKTKITYDSKGLVTSGADATTADINDSTNKRYVTDADLVDIGNLSGTNTGDQTITLTSDVTGSGTGSFATTIANAAVTLAKMANVATGTLFYRKTAGTGTPEVQTLATLKTDLGLTGTNSGDQTSIVGITGTKAQFDTACTDGNFLYVGDVVTSLKTKSSVVVNASFAGNPKKATITFGTAFSNTNYSVSLMSNTINSDSYTPAIESIAAGSFVINMDVNNINNLTDVRWIAVAHGEN